MKQHASLGTNRTGILAASERSQEMCRGMEEFVPAAQGNGHSLAQVRIAYAQEAEPVGSIPMPPTWTGALKAAVNAVTGGQPTLFVDKLGERLAFERSGVRLYEALVSKYDAYGSFTGGPSREDLVHIQQEEYAHFTLLKDVIERLGADPTAVTPSANLHATMATGITQVMVDPRTTLLQSLEAILVAELADNECWQTLSLLAHEAGEEDLALQFERALATEQEHLVNVRAWLMAGHGLPDAATV